MPENELQQTQIISVSGVCFKVRRFFLQSI